MIGEPVASARDLQRYERLLVEKRRELSSAPREAQSRVPAAGGSQRDAIDQANADAEVELQIRLHPTDGRLLRAIEEAVARIRQGTYGVCVVCKRCHGHATAASARSASTRPLDTGNIALNHQREWAMGRGLFAMSLARLRFHIQ